ncbi:flagellar basal body rod protein FlgB [Roseomonas marmotae]|uniref:Flagellar basal body rod protein FlgB n=1 Tax=Roseomonas marmotae TaxID=2768161 RepID=A0ABS3KFA8_9PROT|nr:flagellar basal body rod protein FlgB [Roseomonas marmotae]MBO1076133.1 flagellar basal body rod protein FlgB [Roseomonas marmotae]QTI81267.1 flagellar basal body rod protein FlgB [Roseomonas marmotae]
MLDGIDVFRITGARMRHLAERQNVLAQNIANADTPGFQARDVRPFQFESALLRTQGGAAPLRLAGSQPGHFGSSRGGVNITADRANSYSEDPGGNTVDLEEQMVKQADVAKNYDLATVVYKRSAALLRTAVSSR